jgi:eukaryotic-like serine/threonine-protein kinase
MPEEANQHGAGLEDEAAFEASLGSADVRPADQSKEAAAPHPPAGQAEASPAAGQPAWTGKTLGHFRLLRLLGEGTMGLVIQALDVHLQRVVALKVLRKRIAGIDAVKRVEQFLREARSAARIEHPNVVRIYEINQHAGWWYIAMEMVDGENIDRVVTAAGPLPPARACPLIADAATALAVAHGLGIVHRDVKPTNLMITRGGRCKLTDFGLVRSSDPNDPFDFTDRSVGTPKFMAPELIRRQDVTPAVDVYSLGATLYYTLTGGPPFVGKNVTEILRQHVAAPIPDVRDKAPGCPDSLASLVQRTMAKEPADRPTAANLAAALDAETIAWRADGSGAASGSTVLIPGSGLLTGGSGARPGRAFSGLARMWKSWRFWALSAAVLTAASLGVVWYLRARQAPAGPDRRALARLAERFPDAPETYGVLPPGEVFAAAPLPAEAPTFSWVGKVDTAGLRYVASKRGRWYYAGDDPRARLIRLEDFVGYATREEAEAAQKAPAP